MTERNPIRRRREAFSNRHWVRLTRTCNSRCGFCLDVEFQNGEMRDDGAVRRDIREGLKQGAEGVILSGGEPTVHPEFLSLVAFAAGQGYRWIQVVTNGRMFAYPDFARQAAEAGLTEATLSIHSHLAEVHDATAFGELHQVEQLGFCAVGEGGPFAERGETALGGKIPINISGGIKAKGHPVGATGAAQVYEIVNQLRGNCGPRQVEGVKTGITDTMGGSFASIAHIIMKRGW